MLVGLYARVADEQFDSVSQTERLPRADGDPNFEAPLDMCDLIESADDVTLMFVVYGAQEEADVSTDDVIGSCTITMQQILEATKDSSCPPVQLALVTANGDSPDAILLVQTMANLTNGRISSDVMGGCQFTADGLAMDGSDSAQAAAKAIYNFFATRQCMLFPDKGAIEVSWELLHRVVEAGGGPDLALAKVINVFLFCFLK